MESGLQKLREPAVIVLLVVLVLRLVIPVVAFALPPAGSGNDPFAGSIGAAFTGPDTVTLVVLVLLVGSCTLWSPTRHARALTVAAIVVIALGVLFALVGAVAWISSIDALGGVWRLLDLAVPVLALLGLGRLLGALPRPATGEHQQSLATGTAEAEAPAQLEAAPDPANEPTWQPDQAAGAAWLTAGEAAAGAAATGWGTPGETTGWEPGPSDPAPRDPFDQTERERDQRPRS